MVFAADLFCPTTVALLVAVVWFAGTMAWLRHQREKAAEEQERLDSERESGVSSTS